jgi:hypothetical protein
VPVLWIDYPAIPAMLFGVREGLEVFRFKDKRGDNMLWTIFVVLLVLWLLGFSLHVAGGLIHLLLVVALVVLVINLLSGRRGSV